MKAALVAVASEGVDPIAYCGFSCNHCFLGEWCGSCRSDYNCCSYATICEGGVCPNVKCCKVRGLDGCYECADLAICDTGFYTSDNTGGTACKAQALFIAKYGKEGFLKVHDRLHEKYPDFAKAQEVLDSGIDEAIQLLEDCME